MGGLRAPLRLTTRSARARARFNTDCQKKAEFSTHSSTPIRAVLYDLRGVWQTSLAHDCTHGNPINLPSSDGITFTTGPFQSKEDGASFQCMPAGYKIASSQ